MDLSHPLSAITPSLEGEALTVLAGTESALTGRGIAELARRGSHTAMTQALGRLAHQGLVIVEPAGRAHLYRLNREHLLAPVVLAASKAASEVRSRLKKQIEGWRVPCLHASLYGSLSRGEAGSDSDIDVLVVRPPHLDEAQAEAWSDQLAELERLVWQWTGNTLSWLDTTQEDLRRAVEADEPLIRSWREDSITLAGESLGPLIARLATERGPA